MLVEILDDVFFIGNRIREIDKDYRIFFNTKRKKFEIHCIGQIGNSYCLTVPFSCLDARTVELVRKTRIENRERLINEIDLENQKIQEKNQKNILNDANDKLFEQIKFSKI